MHTSAFQDTIVALATPPGVGAIGVIRVSGKSTIPLVSGIFHGKDLNQLPTHTLVYGTIRRDGQILDEVLVSLFKGPNSYTKEDVVEISTHGSPFILQKVMELLIEKGARMAKPGEFTQRAFINGRFDLAQAEAVADLIAAENEAMQQTAIKQMRGGFSLEIKQLRERLVHFASMIELELDFAEEDVEFANREALEALIDEIQQTLHPLIDSFKWGNAIKNGIPIVIAGKPNAGKSTLLNALLKEEKAIVSSIPGTTRDFIEDVLLINGISYRFIDTAGLREATDEIEVIGVGRTKAKMQSASLILYVLDMGDIRHPADYSEQLEEVKLLNVSYIVVGNKMELASDITHPSLVSDVDVLISAKDGHNLDLLRSMIAERTQSVHGHEHSVVTNTRHYQSLLATQQALDAVRSALKNGTTGDFLALDIRQALFHLGEITGEITTDDLLENIFSKFCIGK